MKIIIDGVKYVPEVKEEKKESELDEILSIHLDSEISIIPGVKQQIIDLAKNKVDAAWEDSIYSGADNLLCEIKKQLNKL